MIVIDSSINAWRRRLDSVVKNGGGYRTLQSRLNNLNLIKID